jgi:hypothetical protein
MAPGTQQRFLYHVLGLLPVASGEPQNVSEQWPAVFLVQGA